MHFITVYMILFICIGKLLNFVFNSQIKTAKGIHTFSILGPIKKNTKHFLVITGLHSILNRVHIIVKKSNLLYSHLM